MTERRKDNRFRKRYSNAASKYKKTGSRRAWKQYMRYVRRYASSPYGRDY